MQITHEADPYLSIQIQKGWDTFDKYYYLSDKPPLSATELSCILVAAQNTFPPTGGENGRNPLLTPSGGH
jgi:hypothetical protein